MPLLNIPEPLSSICDETLLKPRTRVISLVGAGGKTSTLFWLAREFSRAGMRVVVTTTTRMYVPDENFPSVLCGDLSRLPRAAFSVPVCACFSGWDPESGKVRGFAPQVVDRLAKRELIDVLLVEADGARGLPLKAATLHEPCIPASSRCVIAVTGGQVLGQPVGPGNVHRWPVFAALTGLGEGEPLGISALTRFIQHQDGMFKHAPPHAQRIWLINQFSQSEKVIDKLPSLLARTRLDAIWLGAVREFPPVTHVLSKRHDN